MVAACDPKRETSRSMAEMMIGCELKEIAKPAGRVFGEPKLAAEGLSLPKPSEFGVALKDVALSVRAGEIFGVAGVAGNGQNELLSAMSGETLALNPEAIVLAGRPVGQLGVNQRRNMGLCAVPEERNGHAAVSEFSLTDNASLTGRETMDMVWYGLIDPGKAREYASEVIGAFTVKATGPGALAGLALWRQSARNSSWAARSSSGPRRSSSASRPGGSTRARRRPSIRRSSISPRAARRCWSSRRISTNS